LKASGSNKNYSEPRSGTRMSSASMQYRRAFQALGMG
jgi:hypothetical protein